jgi:hypothetical protein
MSHADSQSLSNPKTGNISNRSAERTSSGPGGNREMHPAMKPEEIIAHV